MDKNKLIEYLNDVVTSSDGKELLVKVYKNYEEIFSYKGGYSDEAHKRAADFSDTFYIYSLTKPITCAAALQLFERGLLDIYAPVSKYLPYFNEVKFKNENGEIEAGSDILVWHLFNMSAGFNYDCGGEVYKKAVDSELSTSEVFKATVLDIPLSFKAGEHWLYACRSHEALAVIIEKISGLTFYEYLKQNIFEPLSMEHIRFNLDTYMNEHIADMFMWDEGKKQFYTLPKEFCLGPTKSYESGGYGLISDINDYQKFANAMANLGLGANGNRILSEDTVNLMRRDFLTDKNRHEFRLNDYGYGYGLGVRTLISKETGAKSPLGEFGWDGAAGSYTLFDPENRIAAVLMAHTRSGNKKLDHLKFRDLLY
ncbi:MAG: beta-lactamase family protein [Clostridia bacterium]|nr:beta-lactamase family protein [Clostridia bacterium]